MKHFFRTIGGKVLLFILLTVTLIGMIGCAAGVIIMAEEETFTRTETENIEALQQKYVSTKASAMLYDHFYSNSARYFEDDTDYDGMVYELFDENGNMLAHSAEQVLTGSTYEYTLFFDKEYYGGPKEIFYHLSNAVRQWGAEKQTSKKVYTVNVRQTVSAFEEAMKYELLFYHVAYQLYYWIFIIALACLLLHIICFIALMCVSARRKNDDGLHPGPLNPVPFDLLLGGFIFLCILEFWVLEDFPEGFAYIAGGCGALILYECFLGLCMSIAARIKQHNLIRNTVIFYICRAIVRFFKWIFAGFKKFILALPIIWRTVIFLVVVYFVGTIAFAFASSYGDPFPVMLIWHIGYILFAVLVVFLAINYKTLEKGGEELAKGNLSYQISTDGLLPTFKKHAENLNHLGGGMSVAVDQRIKSERMKTELITNVSHDIKTPLTSIINYTDLIHQEAYAVDEPLEKPLGAASDAESQDVPASSEHNEKIKEYSEVLMHQSDRLKRLIEDLVEASKASSGTLEVNLAPCDANVFITQANGEYDEKLSAKGLSLVVKQPEDAVMIAADGRRMWRVFDNLMNNICKYSQEGTRVYLSLEKTATEAVMIFKNTSKEPLDIPAEELMERFVRGDQSRSSEGNGLGLSIARSLTELQGGSLNLVVDGDLFKAILRFPLIQ